MEGTASREAVTPLLPGFSTMPLSIQTLHSSDFISRLVPQIIYPKNHVKEIFSTPSPVNLPLPGTRTVGRDESLRALQRHMFSRLPAVQEASRTLQNMLGVSHLNDYKAPSQPGVLGAGKLVGANTVLKHLMDDFGGPLVKGPGLPSQTGVGNPALMYMMNDFGGPLTKDPGLASQTGVRTPMTEEGKEIPVLKRLLEKRGSGGKEKENTRLEPRRVGLRETLLWHARQPYGRPKRMELATLSFYDMTPGIDGMYSNELIGDFNANSAGTTRIVAYEVNVIPAGPYDKAQPHPERWISFMITTPIIKVKKDYFLGSGIDCLPPNLPLPIPTSWVIFAAPLSCVNLFLPTRDTIVAHFPTANPIRMKSQVCNVTRYDYDFSLDGVPIFEFMDKRSALGDLGTKFSKGIHGQFLCGVRDLPGWKRPNRHNGNGCDIAELPVLSANSPTLRFKPTRIPMDAEDEMAYHSLRVGGQPSTSADVEMGGQDVNMSMDASEWWTHARVNFWKDSCRWDRIKDTMSRGCCRVIATQADPAGPVPGSPYETGFPSGHPLRAQHNFGPGPTRGRWRGEKRKYAFGEEETFNLERERSPPRRIVDILGPSPLGGKDFPTPAMTATMSLMDGPEEMLHLRKRKRSRRNCKSRMSLE